MKPKHDIGLKYPAVKVENVPTPTHPRWPEYLQWARVTVEEGCACYACCVNRLFFPRWLANALSLEADELGF